MGIEVEAARFIATILFVGCIGFWLSRHRDALALLSPRRAWKTAKQMTKTDWQIFIIASFALIIVAMLLISFTTDLTVRITGSPLVVPDEHPVVTTASLCIPLVFLLMAVLPVFEEWIWRGIVLERLRRRLPLFSAVMISSFGFGLMHLMNQGTLFWAFLPPVIGGFIFSAAYLADGLKCAILTHSGYNFAMLSILFF